MAPFRGVGSGTVTERTSGRDTGAAAQPKPFPIPATVEANARAYAVWVEMVAALGPRLNPVNLPILASYCLAVARLEDAQTKLGTVGPLVKKGQQAQINPLLDVVERELRIVRDTAKELEAPITPWRKAGR